MTTGLRHILPALKQVNTASRPLSLREIGRAICLSPGRAQRVFSRVLGESPLRYQQRVRLDRAAVLLATTDDSVTDIAFAVGFGSHEGFTRAFNRRFGVAPRGYRSASVTEHAATTSPCIGLYHQPLFPQALFQQPEENAMDYEITTRDLEATPTLHMVRRVDKDAFATVLAEVLPAVFQYVMEQGLPMAAPPYVRYMDQSAAFFEIEAGIPLAETPDAPPAETGILAGELPGGKAAVTIHRGPYDTLGEAHIAADRWMADNGETAAGPPWEIYLTDPGEVPDPKDWETELLWPIQ